MGREEESILFKFYLGTLWIIKIIGSVGGQGLTYECGAFVKWH